MSTNSLFQRLKNIPLIFRNYYPKPSLSPTNPCSIIIATNSDEVNSGIYEYNPETNKIDRLHQFNKRDHCLDLHGQFIDTTRNTLYLFGGLAKEAVIYDLNTGKFKENNIESAALSKCGSYSKTVHITSSKINEIHIFGTEKHCKFDCIQQEFTEIRSKYSRSERFSYNPLTKQLMILGGDRSDEIWTFDIEQQVDQTKEVYRWKLSDELKMPQIVSDERDYDVLLVGNIIFVFYFNASHAKNMTTYYNDIWWLDLLNSKWYKSKSNVPGFLERQSYAIKLKDSHHIHLLNFNSSLNFKVDAHELLSKEFVEAREKFYNILTIGYVKEQERSNQIQHIPFALKQMIFKYVPVTF